MRSFTLLTDFIAPVHPVIEGGLVLVALFFASAGLTGVTEVFGYTVGPAVGDWVAFGVKALGNAYLVLFLGVRV